MRRELSIAVGAVTMLGLGMTGYSKGDYGSSGTSSAKTTTASATTAPATAVVARLTVGGQPQNVSGPLAGSPPWCKTRRRGASAQLP